MVENWSTLPKNMNGGRWGELIRADIDPKSNIWVFHRCFNTEPACSATCVGRPDPPILEFDPSGKLLASFGVGMFALPHGFTVDAQGNVSPAGKVLMTLGKQGVAGNGPDTFDQPSGIAVAPNGDIFVRMAMGSMTVS